MIRRPPRSTSTDTRFPDTTRVRSELPRVSRQLAHSGEKVERDALNAGDLVFFSRRGKRVDHVGIYLGNGRFVHAPSTGKDVMVSSLVDGRSEEHTSELQSLMRNSYAVFCLKKKTITNTDNT